MNAIDFGFEYIVTVYFVDGHSVRTAFTRSMQAEAIACWKQYIDNNKIASLTIE